MSDPIEITLTPEQVNQIVVKMKETGVPAGLLRSAEHIKYENGVLKVSSALQSAVTAAIAALNIPH